MNLISISSDFDKHDDYRLLTMDAKWMTMMQSHIWEGSKLEARQCSHSVEPCELCNPRLLFWAKGKDQLLACDANETFFVRRVEYSNSILLAWRRSPHNEAAPSDYLDKAPLREANRSLAGATPVESTPLVVMAALSRVFQAQPAKPRHRLHYQLANSLLTLGEIEQDGYSDEERVEDIDFHGVSGREGVRQRHMTFSDLVRANNSGPREISKALVDMGAVVHRGCVRLVHPSLLHEALRAVLTYVDALNSKTDSTSFWNGIMDYYSSVYPGIVMQVVRAVFGFTTEVEPEGTEATVTEALPDKWTLFSVPKVLRGLASSVFESHPTSCAKEEVQGITTYKMPLDIFYTMWMDQVPLAWSQHGCLPQLPLSSSRVHDYAKTLQVLRGYVVCRKQRSASYTDAQLWWLPEYTLPQDISARVNILFKLCPQKWEADDMRAFIEPLLNLNQSFLQIMARLSREYRIPGEPLMYAPLTT